MLKGQPVHLPADQSGHNGSKHNNQAENFLISQRPALCFVEQNREGLNEDERQHEGQQRIQRRHH
ncbi:hypothetical protein D3C76_1708680 [compost metagenome]